MSIKKPVMSLPGNAGITKERNESQSRRTNMKKKILQYYDGSAVLIDGKAHPVFRTLWQQPDGTYTDKMGRVYVKEVEVEEKGMKPKTEKVEA